MSLNNEKKGICYLVGAGPGDPGLLTLRGRDCLARAEVVYYDYLAAEALLAYAPERAERICVGKAAGAHSVPQEETTRLLVASVAAGKTVVRLKGGDPFVFGRGGEEALALAEAGLRFEVVPGVTSAVAAAAYAGIPVTHRSLSTAVTLVTGHESPEKEQSQTDWEALARGGQTVCVYMGMANLAELAEKFIRYGRSGQEPVAVIRQGTHLTQQTVLGTLADIADKVAAAGLQPPAMIVIGKVAALRERLNWFEAKPLFGKKVVVTRSREQAGALSALLAEAGAQVREMPALQVLPVTLDCPPPLQDLFESACLRDRSGGGIDCSNPAHLHLLANCDSLTRGVGLIASGWPDYLVFTSANGVEHAFRRLEELGGDVRLLARCRVAAIGPATAEALRSRGVRADVVPATFTGEGLLEELRRTAAAANPLSVLSAGNSRGAGLRDQRFLLLRADNARDMLKEGLTEAGAMVEDLVAYQVHSSALAEEARRELLAGGISAVTFASSGTVRSFVGSLAGALPELLGLPRRPCFASIGPVTSATMREFGIPVDLEAEEATIPALARTLASGFRNGSAE